MLYSSSGAVNIAPYKELLNQLDFWKLFVQFWNYTNKQLDYELEISIARLLTRAQLLRIEIESE